MSAPPAPLGGPIGALAEALYRCAVSARGALYDRGIRKAHPIGARVISVGNVTAGGTGKTPVVIELAERLSAAGRRVAIVSRGYGRENEGRIEEVPPVAELPDQAARRYGDEPCLLRRRLPGVPIVLAADRVAGGRRAVAEHGATVVLLDDGMQHRRIRRDVEAVVVWAAAPFGNGRLLPRGPLREPPCSVARADLLFLNETGGRAADLDGRLHRLGAPAKRISFRYRASDLLAPDGARLGAEALRGKPVIALSAIGNPSSFGAFLEESGASLAGNRPFRDHHRFREEELAEAAECARRRGAMLVATEKDAARLPEADRRARRIHTLTISFHLTVGEEYLEEMVQAPGSGGG